MRLLLAGLFLVGLSISFVPVMSSVSYAAGSSVKTKKTIKKFNRTKSRKSISSTRPKREKTRVAKTRKVNRNQLRASIQSWLKKMRKRVARSEAKHNQLIAVASVRGNESPNSPPLYWKGSKVSGPIDLPELRDFDAALGLAQKGNIPGAKTKLDNFIASYPKSSLLPDAQQTLDLISQE